MVWSQLSLSPNSWSYTLFSFLEAIVGEGSKVRCVYSLSLCGKDRKEIAGVLLLGWTTDTWLGVLCRLLSRGAEGFQLCGRDEIHLLGG